MGKESKSLVSVLHHMQLRCVSFLRAEEEYRQFRHRPQLANFLHQMRSDCLYELEMASPDGDILMSSVAACGGVNELACTAAHIP